MSQSEKESRVWWLSYATSNPREAHGVTVIQADTMQTAIAMTDSITPEDVINKSNGLFVSEVTGHPYLGKMTMNHFHTNEEMDELGFRAKEVVGGSSPSEISKKFKPDSPSCDGR